MSDGPYKSLPMKPRWRHAAKCAYKDGGHKADLRARLAALEAQLNRFLAQDYGIEVTDNLVESTKFKKWKATHKPFHWLVEFYGIIAAGGFDAIVGNPPYLETREIDYLPINFATLDSRAIHALFIERSDDLLSSAGNMSMILPMSLVSTQRMKVVQEIIEDTLAVPKVVALVD